LYVAEVETKGGIFRKLLALAAGALAARLAIAAVEKLWTKGLRQDLPEMSEYESLGKKLAWIGMTAAAVGIARELAREITAPRVVAR
jgi:hypothetical protein